MRINFNARKVSVPGRNEGESIYINTALFQNRENGDIIVIDRDETEFSIKGDEVSMLWRGVYIWDSDKSTQDYSINEEDFNENYDFLGFEYEEDEESIILEVTEWNA